MKVSSSAILLFLGVDYAKSFAPNLSLQRPISFIARGSSSTEESDVIVSPFDASSSSGASASTGSDGPLDLTWENVEKVLDEMRPFLIQDGGNVAIKEIDGPVVKLELQVSD